MHSQLTEIVFILDRSGSMTGMSHAAISGFNEFLAAQQAIVDDHGQPLPATFSLVLFDHEFLVVHNRVPIASAAPLTATTYQPRGSTALLDAIGRGIDHLGTRLAATPEAERPARIVFAILTDGEENSSRQYSMHAINQRITHQTDAYSWEFLFLGANQDAIATAASMGIHAHSAATFDAHAEDLAAAHSGISGKVAASRRASACCFLSEEESITLHEPMAETLDKRRKKPDPHKN